MDKRIQSLLEEIYTIDPSLRSRQPELLQLLDRLIKAEPTAQLDPVFRAKLRQRILERMNNAPATAGFWTWFFGRPWAAALPVAAAAVIAIAVWPLSSPVSTDPQPAIVSRGAEAFGQLTAGQLVAVGASRSQSGGGSEDATTLSIAPERFSGTRYEYRFAGNVPGVDLPVLRRLAGLTSASLSGLTSPGLSNLINLDAFEKLEPQQLTLKENRATGYSVTLDFQNGVISMAQGWSELAVKETTLPPTSGSTDAVPSDQELIGLARDFLDRYGIARAGYGEPIVRKDWMLWLAAGTEAERSMIAPSEVTVVYPWRINGRTVYDESGYPYGLQVNISLATKSVTYLGNLSPQRYEASAYEIVTDAKPILEVASRGGLYAYQPPAEPGVTTVQLDLGQPVIAYMLSRYQLDQQPVDYLVPALVFPVGNPPAGQTRPTENVVVPLVQQLIDASAAGGVTSPVPPTLDATVAE